MSKTAPRKNKSHCKSRFLHAVSGVRHCHPTSLSWDLPLNPGVEGPASPSPCFGKQLAQLQAVISLEVSTERNLARRSLCGINRSACCLEAAPPWAGTKVHSGDFSSQETGPYAETSGVVQLHPPGGPSAANEAMDAAAFA